MQPSFISDGTTPRRTDSRWFRWLKILGAFQNQSGADPSNNPKRSDTLRMLQYKVNRATAGDDSECINLISDGAEYGADFYDVPGLIEGNSYQIIFGVNDNVFQPGDNPTVENPGVGIPVEFVAGDEFSNRLFGNVSVGAVTATICAI